jgi:uncharacterized RDD family membrane protein YckC
MTDQGPNSDPPSTTAVPIVPAETPPPPTPPPPPVPRRRRHPFLTFLMVVIGIVALLPGLCALVFIAMMPGGGDGVIALLWVICLAISAGGLFLIIRALR